ncbi:MAG: hypothetical protein LBE36_01415 [Flavobacteriaceae bacterium]|jgi:hypothetical protein|nr:hypothetical protein [Flavobacteriaceae bacterium]
MLTKKITKWLKENEDALLPEYQEKYRNFLIENGFDKNSSFVEFMSQYSDEINGCEGHLFDVVGDLIDYTKTSTNYQIHTFDKVPTNYISLTDDTTECYLLYNKDNDSVVLIEGANLQRLLDEDFDQEWGSFNDFLTEFLEIDD